MSARKVPRESTDIAIPSFLEEYGSGQCLISLIPEVYHNGAADGF